MRSAGGRGTPGPRPSRWGRNEDRNREAWRLRTEEGLTLAQIGAALGVSRQRVHAILRRAMQHETEERET